MVKESAAFIAGHQARRPGQLELKRPELPEDFQVKVFKDRVKDGVCGMCGHSSDWMLAKYSNRESALSTFWFQLVWGSMCLWKAYN